MCACSGGLGYNGSIYGIVVEGGSTSPLSGLGVELYEIGEEHNSLLLKTVTFADGHFEFTDLTSGEYLIKVIANGYSDCSKEFYVSVQTGRQARVDMNLTTTKVSGTVVDSRTGSPISGAMVLLESRICFNAAFKDDIRAQSYSVITDSEGKYEIIDVKQADLSVYYTSSYDDNPIEKFRIEVSHSSYRTYYSAGSSPCFACSNGAEDYNIAFSCGQNLQYDVALEEY